MRGAYCYLPVLRAKKGEFRAVHSLSPSARSRLVPLFDVPVPVLRNGKTLESYLAERAKGIHSAWPTRPLYVDVHDLPLNLRTPSGMQPITYLFDLLRMHGSFAVPVTGTEPDRDRNYLAAVRAIVARDGRGACLRLADDDFAEPQTLGASVTGVLEHLAISPFELDVVFDFRYVGNRGLQSLRAAALEGLQAIRGIGPFRNVIIAGSGVPDMLGKRDQGKVRRESRVEFELWTQVAVAFADRMPIVLADYGAISAYFVPPRESVTVPARIRYTTVRDHVFYRGKRSEYPEICRQLVGSADFVGENFSAGDRRIYHCAKGITGPGNPEIWVATDTNHHLELVSDQVWRFIDESNLAGRFALPEPEPHPWLQPELV